MHIQSELCRVEILDRNNKPAKAGEWGRMIVTPLYNFASPLIRYETGDLVRIAARCACGRNHPAIERIIGRPSNMFYRPQKKWFRPEISTETMENLLGHSRWQLVQTGASVFELRYMPKNADMNVDARKLRTVLRRALGTGAIVKIKPVAALGPASSGKFQALSSGFRP
jgi:phenylacetate-CoA ligase